MVPAMVEQLINLVPWFVVLVIYIGEKFQQFKKDRDFNDALRRAQDAAHGAIVPASTPVAPPPSFHPVAPVPALAPAPSHPAITEAYVAALKKLEGFKAKAYGDFKQWSIGYGTKAKSRDEVIDEVEGDRRLRAELADAVASVAHFAPNLSTGLIQALGSLTYNSGPHWEQAGLGQHIKDNNLDAAKESFVQYVHAGDPPRVLDDLVERRNTEWGWVNHPL